MSIYPPSPPPTAAQQQARSLVLRFGWNSTAYQILNPGIDYWFAPEGDAVVGYVTCSGFRVVAGAPICAPERLAEVVAAFEAAARREREHACYLGASERLNAALATRKSQRVLLGAQPGWNPACWPDVLARKSSLRAQLRRARNKHTTVAHWSGERAEQHPELHRCLREWLATRRLPALHFLVEPETLADLRDRKVFVAEQHGKICGFLVASPIPLRNGWLVEQIVRGKDAPNGTTELLLDAMMRHVAAEGSSYVTLGPSPLSQRAEIVPEPQPLWIRGLLNYVRAYGCRFYNFDGLDAFKAKFLPEYWEPVYATTSERWITPNTFYAIVSAFSGTSPTPMLLRGLWRMLGHECQQIGRQAERLVGLSRQPAQT